MYNFKSLHALSNLCLCFQATVRRTTASLQAAQQLANRQAEDARQESLKRLRWDQLQNANLDLEEKAEDRRFTRRMQIEQKERDMEEAILKVGSIHYSSLAGVCID